MVGGTAHGDKLRGEFRRRRKRQIILLIPLFLLLLGATFLRPEKTASLEPDAEGVAFVVVAICFIGFVVFALFFSFRNWRCPACNAYLGRSLFVSSCSRCGASF